jgi:hypothetical protein
MNFAFLFSNEKEAVPASTTVAENPSGIES